jgi:hypothetical protein
VNGDSNRPVYSEPTNYDLLLTLTRVEGKLDTVHTQSVDHETRLRILEKARWPLPALATLISIASVIAAYWQR